MSSSKLEPEMRVSHRPFEGEVMGDERANRSECGIADVSEAFESVPFEVTELELIEDALQNLQERSHGRQVTNCEQFVDEDEPEFVERSLSSNSQDVDGLARLLKKVQALSAQKRIAYLKRGISGSGNISSGSKQGLSRTSTGERETDSADMRQVVQAASKAALSAAKTAQAVVNSLDRNSLALEELCKTLTSSSSLQISTSGAVEDMVEGAKDSTAGSSKEVQQVEILEMELQQVENTKKIVRQNTITHWVLGFIVVSSFIWRYGIINLIQRVNNTIHNPFQGVTDMFDGLKGFENENPNKPNKSPFLKLPTILPGGDQNDKAKDPKSRPFADKENGIFS